MVISFNLYYGDLNNEEVEQYYHNTICTEENTENIKSILGLNEGYEADILITENITFCDITIFGGNDLNIIEAINSIPQSSIGVQRKRLPQSIVQCEYWDNFSGRPRKGKYFNSHEHIFECGASGFAQTIMVALNDPYVINIITTALWDFVKYIVTKCKTKEKGIELKDNFRTYTIFKNYRRMFRNFELATNLSYFRCGVTYLKKVENGLFEVKIRTHDNKLFELVVNSKGQIANFA